MAVLGKKIFPAVSKEVEPIVQLVLVHLFSHWKHWESIEVLSLGKISAWVKFKTAMSDFCFL